MNIIIIGGTGLIGRAFTGLMLANGHQVWVLTRNPLKASLSEGAQAVKWDGATPAGWEELADRADAIVNLAGENIGAQRWTPERKELIRSSRIKAGQAVVASLRSARRRPRVLLQASAVGYYGLSGENTVDEQSPAGKDFLSNICLDWEAATQPVEELDVRRVLLRTGLVLDQHAGALARLLLPFQLFAGGPLGNGKQWWPWIHLQDQVEAMHFLLENEQASGAYNIMSPNPVTMVEFGRTLARVLDRPFWVPVPAFALNLLLGEMSTMVLEGQRAVPKRLLKLGYHFKFEQLEPALRDILMRG